MELHPLLPVVVVHVEVREPRDGAVLELEDRDGAVGRDDIERRSVAGSPAGSRRPAQA